MWEKRRVAYRQPLEVKEYIYKWHFVTSIDSFIKYNLKIRFGISNRIIVFEQTK